MVEWRGCDVPVIYFKFVQLKGFLENSKSGLYMCGFMYGELKSSWKLWTFLIHICVSFLFFSLLFNICTYKEVITLAISEVWYFNIDILAITLLLTFWSTGPELLSRAQIIYLYLAETALSVTLHSF